MREGELLVTSVIDSRFRAIFNYEYFNPMQSLVVEHLLHSDDNIVIAAPTGSGKTVCHELGIIRGIMQSPLPERDFKCVFIAPNKALCQQRALMWQRAFEPLALKVIEVTGDTELNQSLALIAKANIVITTPEKWDALTRGWRKHIFLLGSLSLLLIDEIHHIDEDRGAVLETVVVRMRSVSDAYRNRAPARSSHQLRVIALSATLPNIEDVGAWLQCTSRNIHHFDETFRPVPLMQEVIGYSVGDKPWFFEQQLDSKVPDVIRQYSDGKQTLIFCPTKKCCEVLSELLATSMKRVGVPIAGLNHLYDEKLKNLIGKGYAFHHAGVPADDRAFIEDLFLKGSIHVLCATSTLAHGVNLPAHLVIVRGTSCWRGSDKGYEKLPRSMIMQMCGRAGRPGFDTSGVAVVMTSKDDKAYYENAALQTEVVESNLQSILVEVLCAEITQTVIEDIADALVWLRSTFFYVRVHKNPVHYGFSSSDEPAELEEHLRETCIRAIKDLSTSGIVTCDENLCVTPLAEAFIMTKNLIKFQTMLLIMQIPSDCSVEKLLQELSQAEESQKSVKRLEKATLNNLLKSCRYPSKLRVKDASQKTFVLLQAAIERMTIEDFTMRVEQSEIVEQSLRVLSAIHQLSLEKEKGKLLESCIFVARSLRQRMWETGSACIFSQMPGIGENFRKSLLAKGILQLGDLNPLSQRQLQERTQCSAIDAQRLLNFGRLLLMNTVRLDVDYSNTGNVVFHLIPVSNHTGAGVSVPTDKLSTVSFQLVCYQATTGKLVCHRKVESGCNRCQYEVSLPDSMSPLDISCSLIADYVGMDVIIPAANVVSSAVVKPPAKKSLSQQKLKTTVRTSPINVIETARSEKTQNIISKSLHSPKGLNGPSQMHGVFRDEPLKEKSQMQGNISLTASATSSQVSSIPSQYSYGTVTQQAATPSYLSESSYPPHSSATVAAYPAVQNENAFMKYANPLEDFDEPTNFSAAVNGKRMSSDLSLSMIRNKSDELGLGNIQIKRLVRRNCTDPSPSSSYNTVFPVNFSSNFPSASSPVCALNMSSDFQDSKSQDEDLSTRHAEQLAALMAHQQEEREKRSMESRGILAPSKSNDSIREVPNKFFKHATVNLPTSVTNNSLRLPSPPVEYVQQANKRPKPSISHSEDLAELSFGESLLTPGCHGYNFTNPYDRPLPPAPSFPSFHNTAHPFFSTARGVTKMAPLDRPDLGRKLQEETVSLKLPPFKPKMVSRDDLFDSGFF